jgi:hypothetical protein
MSKGPPLSPGFAEDMAHWREAWRLRRAHSRWVVFWATDAGHYGAYRLSRAQRDTILSAATPDDLAAQIEHAEQVERASSGRRSARLPRESSR